MKIFETYIQDPVLKSSVQIVQYDSGLWYAFLSNGVELVEDTLDGLMKQLGKVWYNRIIQEAGISRLN